MNETVNYHLPQFVASDRVHHDDFNDAFAKIDTAVKTNSTAIASKASTADLTAETQAREQALTAEATARQNADTALGGRIDSEAAARAAALAAVNANLGSHGHNCRIAFGSYTGSGTYGSNRKNTLTFDFYPVLVMIQGGNYVAYAPVTMVRDGPKSNGAHDASSMQVTWSNSGVSWYTLSSENGAACQMNFSGTTYYYAVLGYDKAAEEA